MFVINCPFCGEREQSEFKAGGEASPPALNSLCSRSPQKGQLITNINEPLLLHHVHRQDHHLQIYLY